MNSFYAKCRYKNCRADFRWVCGTPLVCPKCGRSNTYEPTNLITAKLVIPEKGLFSEEPINSEPLTQREAEVLYLLCRGEGTKEIMKILNLSEATVENYVHSILAKLRVASRTQAVLYALFHRIIDFEK
jgi:DNA-binding NarL/FixJ family response regulator